MKKLITLLILVLTGFILVGCKDTTDDGSIDLIPLEPSTPIETEDEPGEEVQTFFELDTELREQNKSYILDLGDVSGFSFLTITLVSTGTYDDPLTLETITINGSEVNLGIPGIETSAGKHTSGSYTLAGTP